MELFTDGNWYSGLLPGGFVVMWKSSKDDAMKIAAGDVAFAYHALRIAPSGGNPALLSAIMGCTEPMLINGRHFVTVAPVVVEAAKEFDELLTKHFEGPSKIIPATAGSIPAKHR